MNKNYIYKCWDKAHCIILSGMKTLRFNFYDLNLWGQWNVREAKPYRMVVLLLFCVCVCARTLVRRYCCTSYCYYWGHKSWSGMASVCWNFKWLNVLQMLNASEKKRKELSYFFLYVRFQVTLRHKAIFRLNLHHNSAAMLLLYFLFGCASPSFNDLLWLNASTCALMYIWKFQLENGNSIQKYTDEKNRVLCAPWRSLNSVSHNVLCGGGIIQRWYGAIATTMAISRRNES